MVLMRGSISYQFLASIIEQINLNHSINFHQLSKDSTVSFERLQLESNIDRAPRMSKVSGNLKSSGFLNGGIGSYNPDFEYDHDRDPSSLIISELGIACHAEPRQLYGCACVVADNRLQLCSAIIIVLI